MDDDQRDAGSSVGFFGGLVAVALILYAGYNIYNSLGPFGFCSVNRETYDQLQVGMTRQQASEVIGCEGTEQGLSRVGRVEVANFIYQGWDSAFIMATYQDGRLTNKYLMGQ